MNEPLTCICGREVELKERHIYCRSCGRFSSHEHNTNFPIEQEWRDMVTATNIRRSVIRAAEPYIQAAIVGVIECEVEDER